MEIEILKENIFHIFSEGKTSLLDRYAFLKKKRKGIKQIA